MLKRLQMALAIGCLSLTLGVQSARAAVSVELLGNGTYSMGAGTPTPTSGTAYPGGGLNFNFGLGPKLAFQLGGHYVTRLTTTSLDTAFSDFISGNVGFKWMVSRGLSFILGGYYNYYINNPLGLSTLDYGAAAGIGLTIPLGTSVGIYISPVYHYALATQTYGTGNSLTASEIIGFAGLVFGGGAK